MKTFLSAVAMVMACLVVAVGAFAYDYTDHVSVAANGKGDLLIFPVYFALGGQYPISTEFKIINTSKTHSAVAKVVVRSFIYSQELLDFMIYLSPADMWIGRLEYGPNGPRMVSTDKSSPIVPMSQSLVAVTCTTVDTKTDKAADSNQMGYVEVIEAWASDKKLVTNDHTKEIKGNYDATSAIKYPAGTTIDMLSGSYEIVSPTLGWQAEDNALVMKSYDNDKYLNSSVETLIGADARNTIQEVETALNKEDVAMAYNNSTATGGSIHVFTFPTKLSNSRACTRISTSNSAFFPVDGHVKYSKNVYDSEETSVTNIFSPSPTAPDMIDEVQFLSVPADFDFGWVLYNFSHGITTGVMKTATLPNTISYNGTPVIPTIIDFKDGLAIRTASWTDGTVTDSTGTIIPNYQYSSKVVTTTP